MKILINIVIAILVLDVMLTLAITRAAYKK